MSTKADYTKEEWDLLLKAPLMAATVVVAASPSGPIGVLKELFAAGQGLVEGERASNPLIAAVVSDVKAGARPSLPAERPTDIQRVKDQALQARRDVAALLARKAPRDAEGFKRWLMETAQRAAEAAKEGGFLGIGGTRISEAEKGALTDVAGALGVAA